MIRVEGATAYVTTMREAFEACDQPGVDYVVVEDRDERLKLAQIGKTVAACLRGAS